MKLQKLRKLLFSKLQNRDNMKEKHLIVFVEKTFEDNEGGTTEVQRVTQPVIKYISYPERKGSQLIPSSLTHSQPITLNYFWPIFLLKSSFVPPSRREKIIILRGSKSRAEAFSLISLSWVHISTRHGTLGGLHASFQY